MLNMAGKMVGKVVLWTRAASEMEKATATGFAKEGAKVCVSLW